MTRREFETALFAKLEDVQAFHKEYCPEDFVTGDGYLSITMFKDAILCFNGHWKKDTPAYDRPVSFSRHGNGKLYHQDYGGTNMRNLD